MSGPGTEVITSSIVPQRMFVPREVRCCAVRYLDSRGVKTALNVEPIERLGHVPRTDG